MEIGLLRDKINNKPYLRLIETSTMDIPERLREIDRSLFIVRNLKQERFEMHSTENIGNTFCFVIPFKELDSRTLVLARKGDVKTGGIERALKEITESEERREKESEKKAKEIGNAMGHDFYKLLKDEASGGLTIPSVSVKGVETWSQKK